LVAGVVDVDDDAVRVLPESKYAMALAYAPPPSTDQDAWLAVRDALRADPRIPEKSVAFRVSQGVVTLTGSVRTLAQKLAASEDARSALGTWAVVNELAIRPRGGAPPGGLEQRVLAKLRGHASVSADRIRVTADAGVVALEGEVSSHFERTLARRSAASVPGVTAIDDRLVVRADPGVWRTDADLEAAVERECWWDPRVANTEIDVGVKAGVVTLRGEVPSTAVYDAVLENAFQASPRRLVDQLWLRQPVRFLFSN
jgi:osmotically-inducible protein OsmY